ncbi:MAG: ATP-dependent DNA helicase [Myxococcales bacterium]
MPGASLADLLGPGGALARVLPAYEPRASQLEMAEAVGNALAQGRALAVEAGTGTGKTLAYLLPAARSGLKVVVSTATKTLQEQLADKDVPLVRALGVDARFAFLKGRQNYLCLLRKEQFERNPTFDRREEASLYRKLDEWSQATATGDRGELADLPEGFSAFREVFSTAETCTGQKCPHYDDCFVFKMRRVAAEADVVVVNHHLFFADLALRTSSAGDAGAAVLPRYDAVIFDEAHAVEEVATESFGVQLSSFKVAELGRDAGRVLAGRPQLSAARDLATRLASAGRAFFEAASRCRQIPRERPRASSDRQSGETDRWSIPAGSLDPAEAERSALVDALRSLAAQISGADPDDDLSLLERRCSSLAAELSLFGRSSGGPLRSDIEYDEGEERPREPAEVLWGESRAGNLFLHASPLDIATILQDRLYDRIGPVVFTSATLAVDGSLDYFARRVGLADARGPLFPLDTKVLPSPFDYRQNAALYVPRTMPDPLEDGFVEAVAAQLRALVEVTSGRAFVLFTSLRNMHRVHELVAKDLPYQVLLQGDRPKAQLLRSFREKPSVLFASQSFWEGVDVPGDALSLVVIDKLPFASPQEPLVQARIERLRARGEDPFGTFQVPQAALALKQGFGRLIRHAKDRGIVAILDSRLSRRGYGRRFIESLPPARLLRSVEEARSFFAAPDPPGAM